MRWKKQSGTCIAFFRPGFINKSQPLQLNVLTYLKGKVIKLRVYCVVLKGKKKEKCQQKGQPWMDTVFGCPQERKS